MNNTTNGLIIVDMNKTNKQHDKIIGGGRTKLTSGEAKLIHNTFTYDDIINMLIKAQKLRYNYPTMDLACRIDNTIINKDDHPEIYRILSNVYDCVITSNELKQIKNNNTYGTIKTYDSKQIGVDDSIFDDDFEYYQIKQQLGSIHSNHFMFKEHDIEICQRGGFDFRKNKIKFKKQDDPKMKIVCELYNKNCKMIHHDQLKYYHALIHKRANAFDISEMFDNVVEYDYVSPLIKLASYHSENNYYSNLLSRNKIHLKKTVDEKIRLNLIDDILPVDRDSIMLQYLKCRKNTVAITLWKPGMTALNKLVDFLEKNGEVYYIKTINLTKKGLQNLMFAYYDEFSYGTAQKFIDKKLEYVDVTDDNNPVCFILFDNTLNKQISGQGAPFKQYLRKLIMSFVDSDSNNTPNSDDSNNDKKYRGNDMMHINDYFYQTIEYSQIILNDNTIDLMNKQESMNYQLPDFSESNLKMQTFRNVLYKTMSLLEIDRMITVGGTIFYAHGVRSFNDIDAILIDNQPNNSTHLVNLVDKYFSDKRTKFFFLDAAIQGSTMWNDSWTRKDTKILDFLEINNYKDLVLDPNNHFYFQGIKMATLEYEMLRKLIRNRTEDHVDFMMLNLLYPQIIKDYVTLKNVNAAVLNATNKTDATSIVYGINDSPYFIIADKYTDIAGDFDDRFPESKIKILKRRYTTDQIKLVQTDNRFKYFFGSSSVVPE